MKYYCKYASPIGNIIMAGTDDYLELLIFECERNDNYISESGFEEKITEPFAETMKWLDCYFGEKEPDFVPPYRLEGTDFQKSVWSILEEIPYGSSTSYGSIASQIAGQRDIEKMSAQAVGNAVGRNPISIIVPCHRVLGKDGSLTGYAGGLDKKVFLLKLENVKYKSDNVI